MTETEENLDVEAPNESAPGHDLPTDAPEPPGEAGTGDPDAPNESAPEHNPRRRRRLSGPPA